MQVIGDWVASHTHEEVLAAMAEARVPSGQTVNFEIPAVCKAKVCSMAHTRHLVLTWFPCMCFTHTSIGWFPHS